PDLHSPPKPPTGKPLAVPISAFLLRRRVHLHLPTLSLPTELKRILRSFRRLSPSSLSFQPAWSLGPFLREFQAASPVKPRTYPPAPRRINRPRNSTHQTVVFEIQARRVTDRLCASQFPNTVRFRRHKLIPSLLAIS